MPTASIHTLGCRLNQADSALMADDLQRHGFSLVPWGATADLLIINSCSVTGLAAQKTRQIARAARRRHPEAFIILAGCEATAEADFWCQEETVDLVVTNPKPQSIFALLPSVLHHDNSSRPRLARQEQLPPDFTVCGTGLFYEHTRANLKIQEGCDFRCTYCLVPDTRGHARSRDLNDVLDEAKRLVERGYREIVLTGVNISTYHSHGVGLPDLLLKLLALSPDFRLRLGSTEPGPAILPHIVAVMAQEPRVCRFLHLPIQYGEDTILQGMGRKHYDCQVFAQQALEAVDKIPELCLGTDVIVGFPGETEELFQRCYDYLKELPFGLMHIFPYSPRKGTPAAEFKGRPQSNCVTKRSHILLELANQKAEIYAQQQIGRILPVLIEKTVPCAQGWTDNYLQVKISRSDKIKANTIVPVRITGTATKRSLLGSIETAQLS